MLHQIKAPQNYTDLGLQKTVLNPLANGKIQGLFKAFVFQLLFKANFIFKIVLFIQVLVKPVQTLPVNVING